MLKFLNQQHFKSKKEGGKSASNLVSEIKILCYLHAVTFTDPNKYLGSP
jgi:hypothetical protein